MNILINLANRKVTSVLLAILSAVLLYLSRSPFNFWIIVWFAYVPVLYALENLSIKSVFIVFSLLATVSYYINLDWLEFTLYTFGGIDGPVLILTKILLCMYISLNHTVFGIAYKIIKARTNLPILIFGPIVYAALSGIFPIIFRHSMVDTQILFPIAVQGSDIFGVSGLQFIVMLSNCLILTILKGDWKKQRSVFAFSSLLFIGWWSYGVYKYNYWKKEEANWPAHKIGILQPNTDIKASDVLPNENTWELLKTRELAEQGAVFVIWPEGKRYFFSNNAGVRKLFKNTIDEVNTNLIFGDLYYKSDPAKLHNAMVWIKPDGSEGPAYLKLLLMPFGEYFPGGKITKNLLKKIGFQTYSLIPGEKNIYFTDENTNIQLLPLICYETLFAENAAKMVSNSINEQKNYKKLIIAGSQDGWYNSLKQNYEHIYASIGRSVESRLPFLHVIQNGISTLTMPSGDHIELTEYETQAAQLVNIRLNPAWENTFFTKHPYLTKVILRIVAVIMLLYALFWRTRKRPTA